jgi:hypothetical protein
VVHEAAVLGGVRGLTDEFVDPGDAHDGIGDFRWESSDGGGQGGGVLFLAADEGEDDSAAAEKHEGENAEHGEDGKSLRLTDEAALVRETSSASEGWERWEHAGL